MKADTTEVSLDDVLPQFKLGNCASCRDSDVLLRISDNEEEPNSYVCKECFLRGY